MRSTLTLLRGALMQALQICVRLSTARSSVLRATREFFSHMTHFFFKESEGWSATPLQGHNYGFCGGKVRVIGDMMLEP